MSLIGASFFRNPPAGLQRARLRAGDQRARWSTAARDYTQGEALRTPQWYLLTAILTLNVTAGIALISQAAASATDIAGYTAAGAAAVVGVLAMFNGGGPDLLGGGVGLHRPDAGVRRDAGARRASAC